MRRIVRLNRGLIARRPCWIPEGSPVRLELCLPPFVPGVPKRVLNSCDYAWVEYPVRGGEYRHPTDQRIQEFIQAELWRINERLDAMEEGYFLALTAAYRAIGPCWQVDFIPDMMPRPDLTTKGWPGPHEDLDQVRAVLSEWAAPPSGG